ncbi:hypothetical protein [Phytohabitans aurantiacus]|uniref:SpoVT-AbrB domain-containing protein n=1 Tax=Phytohabitans aurantiacus TaxID=3016789 RepID=A0ABQ5R4T8_9ACTN|nr:hypothetical protein [Phytohabitans aurantiacus]GLI00950.1 hypothetical protein Pa4123_62260 [Phytohabitans aurantiacus]
MIPAPAPDSRHAPSEALPDAAVTIGAQAVAAFADRHTLAIPAKLREDLAREVLVAAGPHLTTGHEPGD